MWPERIQQSKAPEWPSAETMNLTLVANLKWSFPTFTDRLFVYRFCFPRALKLHFNTLSQSSVNSPINWHAPVYCLVHHHKARGQRVTGCLVSSKNTKTAAQMRSRGGEQSWRTKRVLLESIPVGSWCPQKGWASRAVSAAPCCGLTAGWGPICVCT